MDNPIKNNLLSSISDNLTISYSHTVQPNVLVRTPLFTPVARNSNKTDTQFVTHDVSHELKDISIFKKEGYEYASMRGLKLNMRTDFKIWCGVVFAFSKYGYNTDCITMKLSEFTKLSGFSTQMLNATFRKRVQDSLNRIQSQRISMKSGDNKKAITTSLLKKFVYDTDKDEIILEGDPDLWELYLIDPQILISMKTLSKIPRFETAQCLYLYFASLPSSPIPVTLSRLRERLSLSMNVKESNRAIKAAIKKLEEIGYLEGQPTEWKGEWAYSISDRKKSLPELV